MVKARKITVFKAGIEMTLPNVLGSSRILILDAAVLHLRKTYGPTKYIYFLPKFTE